MTGPARQRILVSGLGGQGVLFLARLLAETAIRKGMAVLTSETHGMAQRGGVVTAHLKAGPFSSPLIAAGTADGLLLLRAENLPLHRPFGRPGGFAVVNAEPGKVAESASVHAVDADGIAVAAGNPQGANLVLLGFAAARLRDAGPDGLFCTAGELREAVERRFGGKQSPLSSSLAAFDLGIRSGTR